jgi:hypothetical protein
LLKSSGRFIFAGFTLSCVAKAMLPPYSGGYPEHGTGRCAASGTSAALDVPKARFRAAAGFNRMVGTLLTQATVESGH